MAILNRAETAVTWNLTVQTIREARRYVEELMMLNLTVPAVTGGWGGRECKMKKQTVGAKLSAAANYSVEHTLV